MVDVMGIGSLMRKRLAGLWLGVLLGLVPMMAAQAATDGIARVIAAVGAVVARQADGTERPLARESAIREGDTLVTAKDARAQIRFSDGSLVFLRPETEFRVDEYRFQGQADGSERASYSLLKGGLRTITGAIGKQKQENYKVNTPVSTIGIRGTHYGLRVCAGDCADAAEGERVPDGLYGTVLEGSIANTNDAGESLFQAGQHFRVAGAGAKPEVLLAPPTVLFGEDEGTARPEAETEGKEQGSSAPRQQSSSGQESEGADYGGRQEQAAVPAPQEAAAAPAPAPAVSESFSMTETVPDLSVPTNLEVPETLPTPTQPQTQPTPAPIGSGGAIAFIMGGSDHNGAADFLYVDGGPSRTINLSTVGGIGNVPVSAEVFDGSATGSCNPCTFSSGTAILRDDGGDAVVGLNWGRWDVGYQITENGVAMDARGSFHYVYSPNITPADVLPNLAGLGSSVTFSYVGGPRPTDEAGIAGVVNGASVTADFVNQQFTAMNLNVTVGNKTYVGTLDVPTSFTAFSAIYAPGGHLNLTGACTGGACGANTPLLGEGSAAFLGPNAEGAVGGFTLSNAGKTVGVSGVGVFKRP